jgi:hypothetical protein
VYLTLARHPYLIEFATSNGIFFSHLQIDIFCQFNFCHTGKSLSETLIFASTNPKYDDRLFIELQVQYMKIPSSNLGRTCCSKKSGSDKDLPVLHTRPYTLIKGRKECNLLQGNCIFGVISSHGKNSNNGTFLDEPCLFGSSTWRKIMNQNAGTE